MAVFASCEKDDVDYGDAKQFGPKIHGPASYLEGARAEQAKQLLNGLMSSPQARQKSNGWTVDFSEILLVTDTLGNQNYTFRVLHPNSVPDEFYNLVLTENINTLYSTVKLVRYKMDDDFATRFNSGAADITQFTGTITFTPIADGGELTPPTEPGEDPEPNPGNDPCEEESIIEIPNPGSSNGGIGSAPGGSPPGGGNNGSGPILPDEMSYTARCHEWITIPCNGGEGHVGDDDTCTGSFKGATYLVDKCRNTVLNLYGRPKNYITYDPCGIIGNIGVLPPRLLHLLIDPAFATQFPCQSQIVVDAYSVCSDLNDIFLNVFAGSETMSVNFMNLSTLPQLAVTTSPIVTQDPNGFNNYHFTIKLRDSFLTSGTDLAIASTVIHENVHAILYYFRYTDYIYTMFENPTYQNLLDAYISKLIALGHQPAFYTGNQQHDFMAEIVGYMATTIKAYGESKGYNLPNSYYNAMAWQGLTRIEDPNDPENTIENPIFVALVPDMAQRDEINLILKVENLNQAENGITPSISSSSCNQP
jgi:hypothetical protein